MPANTGQLDLGALQSKDSGAPTAQTGYLDLGALQHTKVVATAPVATARIVRASVRDAAAW